VASGPEAAAAPSGPIGNAPSRDACARVDQDGGQAKRRWWPAVVCCGVYVVLAILVFGPVDAVGSSHMTGTHSPDVVEQIWWLAWTAFALPGGHNVLAAQWQNYPAGENFGANGSMLALGILFMPITKLFGPIVAWNVAVRLALAVSAGSMCLVLRRWTTWWPATFVGGVLYGFSTYAVHFGVSLLFLSFAALPPVVFLLLHEILVRQRWRPRRTGALLGVLCALQFFIWSEVLASTVLIGAIAVALFLLISRHDLISRWRYAVTAFAYSVGVGGLLLVAPVFYTFFGPQSIKGTPVSSTAITNYPSDLFGAFVPSSEWLTTNGLTALAATRFPYGTDLYLGLPLIAVLACFAIFFRKRRAILFAGIMALISLVLSLGPRLRVDGHDTPIVLPFVVLQHLPLVEGLVPVRFSLYTALFTAAMFAIGLDELWRRLRQSGNPTWLSPRWRIVAAAALSAAITVAAVIPLVSRHTQTVTQTDVPSFFTSTAVNAIPQGSVVLAYPYPDFSGPSLFYQPTHDIMLDQAVSGMRFKLIGGYGWFPSSSGDHGTANPTVLEPQSVEATFDSAYYGRTPPKANAVADLRVFLKTFDVQSVIALPEGADPALVISDVTAAIGCPIHSGGVLAWLHVKQRLKGNHPFDATGQACGAIPNLVTKVLKPANGATLSGTSLIDSTASDVFPVTKLEYYVTGGDQHDALVATGRRSPIGWVALWNTTAVPNGTYMLRSVARDSDGRSGSSKGITITVRN
jgi:hypothetical protein